MAAIDTLNEALKTSLDGEPNGRDNTGAGYPPSVATNGAAPSVNVVVQNQQPAIQAQIKTIDKNVFTWVFCFLLGGLGVDRFVRGQVGTGIAKLLLALPTLGIWALIDWIIALTKAYGNAFKNESNFTFVNGKYAR